MIQSVFQRMIIIHESDDQLIIREQPIMDWVIAGACLLTSLIMLIAQAWVTGILSLVFAVIFFTQASTRTVTFDTDPNVMTVFLQSLIGERLINEVSLHTISRAYLYRGDDGGIQVVLTMTDGEELGLSGYIKAEVTWQEEIVLAINGILHNAHKDDPNRDLMV